MSHVVRLRRYAHIGCEHDIPIDVTMPSDDIPVPWDRIMAPVEGDFLLVIERVKLELPEPAVHSSETIGTPEWELRVLRLNEEELIAAGIDAIKVMVKAGVYDEADEHDAPPPLIN